MVLPVIRDIAFPDVQSLFAIQNSCPEIAQWTPQDYERLEEGKMVGWVAEGAGEVLGFIIARRIVSDIEVLNLAVSPVLRRKGIASSLLERVFAWGNTFRAERAILEVRESNVAALRFYERHQFVMSGRRPKYYRNPDEDALLLISSLPLL